MLTKWKNSISQQLDQLKNKLDRLLEKLNETARAKHIEYKWLPQQKRQKDILA